MTRARLLIVCSGLVAALVAGRTVELRAQTPGAVAAVSHGAAATPTRC